MGRQLQGTIHGGLKFKTLLRRKALSEVSGNGKQIKGNARLTSVVFSD
jgi:hypothetical protein